MDTVKNRRIYIVLLVLVLVCGAALRLFDLSRGDAISDEVLYGFRAIGYLDFDFAIDQPTPLQLFHTTIPWWTRLSFHDHPPLVFLIQHWTMRMFGDNLWGMRLPSALFGIASVFLVYVLGRKLFSRNAGLIAAALLASNVLMLYVSRTAVQESQVIFFILLTAYLFFKALDDRRWFLGAGAALGLGLLSKYTVAYIFVPCVLFLIMYRRDLFRSMYLYVGAVIACVAISPVIIYNIMLYQTFGHFDFQLFYIFGQKVTYWQSTPGKEIGSLATRIRDFPVNMWLYNSPLGTLLAALSFLVLLWQIVRKKLGETARSWYFLLWTLVINTLLYLFIGPAPRFLTMLVPWLCLLIGAVIGQGIERLRPFRKLFVIFTIIIVLLETAFAVNSCIVFTPQGREILAYSKIHWDMHAWGYNILDGYIEKIIAGTYPSRTIPYSLPFLEDVKQRAISKVQGQGKKPTAILFVYNASMSDLATLWVINRHALYEAWPMIAADNYLAAQEEKGNDFYAQAGFTDLYFIQPTDNALLVTADRRTNAGDMVEKQMINERIQPDILKNAQGKDAFRVYHLVLDT